MLLAVWICMFTNPASGQIPISGQWYFHKGDLPEAVGKISPRDSNWIPIKVPAFWEDQGFPEYNGFGWYALQFSLADTVISRNSDLYLVLGYIDDVDQSFLNGVEIGHTGTFPPHSVTEYRTLRRYILPKNLLRRKNILRIRVYDSGGPGGIYEGPFGIYTLRELGKTSRVNTKPHRSFYNIPTSNGLAAAVYNTQNQTITHFYPHIYKQYNQDSVTTSLLNSGKFQLSIAGKQIQLSEIDSVKIGYLPGTGIIQTVVPVSNGHTFKSFFYVPFSLDKKVLVAVGDYQGTRLDKVQIGFTADYDSTKVVHLAKVIHKSNNQLLRVDLFGINDHSSDNLYKILKEYASSFQSSFNGLQREKQFWTEYHANEQWPTNVTNRERSLLTQSTTIIKMAQVREPGRGYGQILASLPPGQWNISWVRDMAYAVQGLLASGHLQEARDALQFQLHATSGQYQHFTWDGHDYGVKHPYQISVCRYYGNGQEWSDSNENGPNIELDGFGLFLWTLNSYWKESGDRALLSDNWDIISNKIGKALMANIDSTNCIRPDSGPWERHLPGAYFAYTTFCAAQGLKDLSDMAKALGKSKEPTLFRHAYRRLESGLGTRFVNNTRNVVIGKYPAQDMEDALDGAAVEAINWNLAGNTSLEKNTLDVFNTYLRMPKTGHGFHRIADGDWYDRQEWVFLDLRIASAWYHLGNPERGDAILSWITRQSNANYNLIAELYDETTSDYQGAVPMAGFGCGAYILSIIDKYGSN